MSKRQLTLRYIIFYILFSPDAWQVLIGFIAAYYLTPLAELSDKGNGTRAILFIMIGTIGYAASRIPSRWITRVLIKLILGEKRP